jgi:hypothetical protein
MAATAEEFFVAVRDDDMDKAMTCLSEDFQASTPLAELRRFLDANGLNRFREARWASRSRNGNQGTLSGSITVDSGGVVPLAVGMVKGASGWKIHTIQKLAAGVQTAQGSAAGPHRG